MIRLVNKARERFFFRLIYWMARIGLALTFVISGIRKLPGIHFTELTTATSVGSFFATMEEMGFYWHSIGVYQVVIGILLLFNRWVAVSSILLMSVTVNIFLVSVALQMKGTPFITAFMLLGNILLLIWHYENFLSILKSPSAQSVKWRKN